MWHCFVKSNELMCLLDSRTTHLFLNPKVVLRLNLKVTKVAKPIKVWLTQRDVILMEEMVLGVKLLCGTTKFKKDFMITLDGFDAILSNTYLNVYHIEFWEVDLS